MNEIITSIPANIIGNIQSLDLNIQGLQVNQEINGLLQRTVLLGGKRLRPLLTFLMGDFFKCDDQESLNICAKSIEMVHAASLGHDDVVDQATMRRGHPSINIESSNKHAVLAGDYLLANVIVELSNLGRLELVKEMSFVIQSLAEGEWVQLEASNNRLYSDEVLKKIALCKTASVMQWCCVAPAIINNSNDEIIDLCRQFGNHLGLAFQLLDDTFDFNENSQKDQFLDLKNGIVNTVVFEWLKSDSQAFNQFKNNENILDLIKGQEMKSFIAIIKERAKNHLNNCESILDNILTLNNYQKNETYHALLQILHYLESRGH